MDFWNDFPDFDIDSWSHCKFRHIQNDEIRKYLQIQKNLPENLVIKCRKMQSIPKVASY